MLPVLLSLLAAGTVLADCPGGCSGNGKEAGEQKAAHLVFDKSAIRQLEDAKTLHVGGTASSVRCVVLEQGVLH